MLISAIIAFIHFASAFYVVKSVFDELRLVTSIQQNNETTLDVKSEICQSLFRDLDILNRQAGIAVALLILAGVLRVFFYGKGITYYTGNFFFWLKIACFVTAGILAVLNARRYTKWRTSESMIPSLANELIAVKRNLHTQLLALTLVALCASMMAHGLGN